jgi:8-oxo-dGTP diphosphatase
MGAGAIITYKGKVLLVLRDNKPEIKFPNYWGMIGGRIEPGETPEQALIREIKEEINVDVTNPTYIAPYSLDPQNQSEIFHITLDDNQMHSIKLGDEGQELRFFSLDELETLCVTPDVTFFLKNFTQILKNY